MATDGTTTSNKTSVTFASPTNIAVIKYWGKRVGVDKALNLPLNGSVSVTLNMSELRTVTTVSLDGSLGGDSLWLNGSQEDAAANPRIVTVLKEIRSRSERPDKDTPVSIVSENNFPTAAGSAAGYSCLVAALADLFGVSDSFPGELTTIARMGSGSACRSLFGGFVRWNVGSKEDGTDSIAEQVADEGHWPDLHVLILVVSDQKKDTSSTSGMATSVATSPLLAHRAEAVVERRLADIQAAYLARDFDAFGELTMKDSNQFHACCADTYPPIFYMTDVSRAIVRLVHRINAAAGRVVAAYTFDAGPNAVLYLLKDDVVDVLAAVLDHFPHDGAVVGPSPDVETAARAADVPAGLRCDDAKKMPGVLTTIYHTTVGEGAKRISDDQALTVPTGSAGAAAASE